MSLDQMLWHVNTTLQLHLGEITAPRERTPLPRSVMKFLVLNLPWPRGAPTLAKHLARQQYDFADEHQRCLQLIDKFTSKRLEEEWPENLSGMAGGERTTLAVEPKRAESTFEELFLQHYGRILSVLLRLVGDRGRAEELTSDVFLKLYRSPLPPRPGGNPGGWLYRTATHLGIDALRATARRQRYEQAASQSAFETRGTMNPLDEALQEERCSRVRAVLAALKPAQAQILILRSSGLSYNDLAESLGVQRGSVGTMLARAGAEFQKRYLEMYGEKEDL